MSEFDDNAVVLIRKGESLLLGEKNRGVNQGKITALGGGIMTDESPLCAAVREVYEEARIKLDPKSLELVGINDFYFHPANAKQIQRIYVFMTDVYKGEPRESEEMIPEWHPIEQLPYEHMWADAKKWLPHLLEGEKSYAQFLLGENRELLESQICSITGQLVAPEKSYENWERRAEWNPLTRVAQTKKVAPDAYRSDQ